ncbi:hypothetical protein D0T49_08365 [Paludibacter sp. 221]|uniref:archaeosortase/exosortase family protein n=1 Tax=Paludibacter sp. 221 TaxID=2302939 RepID=UPI0013D585B4|nr:archaeosortase/exosortase family protein [Paludibacter sp. 221]NDV47058.1 hypothetical protein [Paludibacter sp. 221]
MKSKKNIFPEKLEPYKGIIYFVIILLISNYFWKFTVKGDESDTLVTFFGLDISAPFIYMSKHFADMTAKVLQFFGSDVILGNHNNLYFDTGYGVRIVWACTGIKQAYIFTCIIAFTRGPWKKKLWYIPMGILIVYLFNLFRLTVITACVKNHFDWFDFLHEGLFKYIFYGVIFLMWVIWDEKIAMKGKNLAAETTEGIDNQEKISE